MKYTFQHFLDISTSATSLTNIAISAGGQYVFERCKHLFGAYKYFKLGKISIKLIPASTLPVDPLGLSYESGEVPTVDPRDQMNPGLVRITNGENVLHDFTGLSDVELQQMYTNTMLDPRWSKFMLQSGFKRSAYPLFWNVAQEQQNTFPSGNAVFPHTKVATPEEVEAGAEQYQVIGQRKFHDFAYGTNPTQGGLGTSILTNMDGGSIVETGHRVKMGWLPTDSYQDYQFYSGGTYSFHKVPLFNRIPRCEVINIILPKALRTLYYYRLFITETVYFSGIKNVGVYEEVNNTENEFRGIDNFVHVPFPVPARPSQGYVERAEQNGYIYEKSQES